MTVRRLFPTAVLLVAVLAAGVAIGAVVFGRGNGGERVQSGASVTTVEPSEKTDPQRSTQAAEPSALVPLEGLEGEALALAEVINRAAGLTYHATYTGSFPGKDGKMTNVTLDIWRRPPLGRRDTNIRGGDRQVHTAEYLTAKGTLGCLLLPGRGELKSQWKCTPAPADAIDPGHPVVGSVDPRAGTVVARDGVVRGIAVRCYEVKVRDVGPQEACFDADGIPAAIDGGDGRLERSELQRGVPDEVFVPPADATSSAGA